MRHRTETYHVQLVLVTHQEVLRGKTDIEPQTTGLLGLDLAVGLQRHAQRIIYVQIFTTRPDDLFVALAHGVCGALAGRLELHLYQFREDLHCGVEVRLGF